MRLFPSTIVKEEQDEVVAAVVAKATVKKQPVAVKKQPVAGKKQPAAVTEQAAVKKQRLHGRRDRSP